MSKEDDKFPVLHHYRREPGDGMPDLVKWSELSEDNAWEYHGQCLERLASRGGLSPREIVANVRGKPFRDIRAIEWAAIKIIVNEISV